MTRTAVITDTEAHAALFGTGVAQKAIKKSQNTILEDALVENLRLAGLPTPEREVLVVPGRKFRVDLAWPDQKVCCEVQGGIFAKERTGHSSGVGIQRDAEKANLIVLAGWRLLKVTSNHIESGAAVSWIEEALKGETR